MPKKTKSPAPRRRARPPRRTKAAPPASAAQTEAPVLSPPPAASEIEGQRIEPRTHRELAQAIFSECNPVKVGRELLKSGSEKGASVRARVFETLANWQFGKPAAPSAGQSGVRVIWDVPRPPRESEDPQ